MQRPRYKLSIYHLMMLICFILFLHLLNYYVIPLFGLILEWFSYLIDFLFISAFVPFSIMFFKRLRERDEFQNQIESLYEEVDAIIWLKDAKTNEMLQISNYVYNLYGYTVEEIIEQPNLWYDVIHPKDRVKGRFEEWQDWIKAKETLTVKYRIIHKDQSVKWVREQVYPIYSPNGELVRLGGMITDITNEEEANKQVRYLVFHDSVTDFANYEGLKYTLAEKVRANQTPAFSLYMIKVSRLNFIREHVGQLLADQVTKLLAERLSSSLFPETYVARVSDSRFAVIDEVNRTKQETVTMFKRLIKRLEEPVHIDQYEFFLTISIGIVKYPEDGRKLGELEKNAHFALDYAKKHRLNYVFFREQMVTKTNEMLRLEADLRKAIERKELLVYYQPKVNVTTNAIVGVEALLRWKHSSGKFIPPNEFIPLAERTGLILSIGDWIIEQACRQMREWIDQEANIPSVSINLSMLQLFQYNLVEKIKRELSENKLDPHSLELEITETMVIDQTSTTLILEELKKIGVRLSIDDFGTGYSSLDQLRKMPIDTIKIDRSFVRDIMTDKRAEAMISTLINMSKLLELDVVVEGVETAEQVKLLREHGCDIIQGFYFSAAIPAHQMIDKSVEINRKMIQVASS